MEKFDYIEALKKLEEIAVKVEDPGTELEAVEKFIRESDELIEKCRTYLRTSREEIDKLDR